MKTKATKRARDGGASVEEPAVSVDGASRHSGIIIISFPFSLLAPQTTNNAATLQIASAASLLPFHIPSLVPLSLSLPLSHDIFPPPSFAAPAALSLFSFSFSLSLPFPFSLVSETVRGRLTVTDRHTDELFLPSDPSIHAHHVHVI